MSASGHLSMNLLDDIPATVNSSSDFSAVARVSTTLSGHALPADAACRGHEAEKNLKASEGIGLLRDFPRPHATSSAISGVVGSPQDLLGDEICEPPVGPESPRTQPATVDAAAASKNGLAPEAVCALVQLPGALKHDQQRGTPSNAVATKQQQQENIDAHPASGYGAQQRQQHESAATEATSICVEDPHRKQHQLPGANQLNEALNAKATQPEQRSASPSAVPSVGTFNSQRASLHSDGLLEGKAVDRTSGGGSQSLPSDTDRDRVSSDDVPSGMASEASSGQGDGGDERIVDSDRDLVEEEDAFGDFADFTSASHFLPGGGGGLGAAGFTAPLPPPQSASSVAAARATNAGPTSTSSPSAHRHAHLGGLGRPIHGMLGGIGGPSMHHGGAAGAASVSGAVSEHGSLAGEFSDVSHQSPPPSVAPSRGGGGRKSVASIASVGSRAGGDDDLGDYNSVVGSSVWRAPSQMATSSYAAAAGADDDFGDFTSDITSTSDFAPSTQPPSAVAVSGPGSVHPDDDFGSFASHRSTADDDEDDFGNFNAAPAAVGPAAAAGAGPSGSGGAVASVVTAGAAGLATAAAGGVGSGVPGSVAAAFSPRDAAAGPYPYHSTQSVGPLPGGSTAVPEVGTANEAALLQLPSAELRQAVARALQPLLPVGMSATGGPQIPDDQVVSAAWAQLRRHMQGNLADAGSASVFAHNGAPLSPIGAIAPSSEAGSVQDGSAGRGGIASAIKFTRPLRWKGSDSERRLLSSLGLSEVAAQVRMAEPAEGLRQSGRGRLEPVTVQGGGGRLVGPLASFGDAPVRRARADTGTISAGLYRDTECDGTLSSNSGAGTSRSRGLDQNGETHVSLPEQGAEVASGATPRPAGVPNGLTGGHLGRGPAEK